MLSSRSFMVLCFTFRSMTDFELILMRPVRSVSRFIFVGMWISSCSNTIFSSYDVLRRIERISEYSEERDQDDEEALYYAIGEQA